MLYLRFLRYLRTFRGPSWFLLFLRLEFLSFFQQEVSACWRFLFNLFIICKFNKRLNRRRDMTLCFAEISRTLSFPSPKPSCVISFCWITLQTCNLVLQNIADMYRGKEAMHLLPLHFNLTERG